MSEQTYEQKAAIAKLYGLPHETELVMTRRERDEYRAAYNDALRRLYSLEESYEALRSSIEPR